MARQFYSIDTYQGERTDYRLLPFRFTHLDAETSLVVNEVGEHAFLSRGDLQLLIRHQLHYRTDLYKTLKAKQFLYDSASAPLLDLLATKYRTKKSFLDGFSKLHILVVTLRCDHTCHYCQVSRQTADRTRYDMSIETAERSLSLMMRSPSPAVTLELQGGEPLLAFDTIRQIVPRAKELAAKHSKKLDLVITTNLAFATKDILEYCRDEQIKISTSLDGPVHIHNANRPRPGNDSYEKTIDSINRARDILGIENVAAVMTTTRLSLDYPIEIIDEYVRRDFRSIFLRPISPYGFAIKTRKRTGYHMDLFIQFYRKALDYIISLNRQGVDLAEVYARILLTKILTPFPTHYVDLQSPFGAGINVLVYNYNGDVFASDEARMLAEMNDSTFCLGNVHKDSYESIYTGRAFQQLLNASCNEALPGCADCAFLPYCGADPIFHHATQGDLFGHRPTSTFCHKNMEINRYLFSLLAKADGELMRIFFAWMNGRSVSMMKQSADACV